VKSTGLEEVDERELPIQVNALKGSEISNL